IASVLSGDLSDAYRYAVHADEWIRHFYRQKEDYQRDKGGPGRLDIASVPLCLVAQDRGADAAQFMRGWKDWYAYEVSERIFTLLLQAERTGTVPSANIRLFLDSLNSQPGVLAAALSFLPLENPVRRRLVRELAKACEKKKTIEKSQDFYRERTYLIQDGLLKAAAIAVAMKTELEARSEAQQGSSDQNKQISYDTKRDAEHFIDERLEPLFEITQALAAMLSVGSGKGDKRFLEVVDLWTKFRMKRERYSEVHEKNWFFDLLGQQLIIFALWARPDIKASSAEVFVSRLSEHGNTSTSTLIEIVAIFAK